MTPAQAIRHECRRCRGGHLFRCESAACSLNDAGRPLPKIKAHCKTCNGDDHPRECVGKLLDGTTCILHDFRLGRNPFAKKRILSPENRAKLASAGRKYRFATGQNAQSIASRSKIATSGVPEAGR